ncbi:MAG: SGNH/GDSL hydrolase family protein, partial [Planctomycetes bacterium]|nr:SGNH/GDSL hydrolase family protein [Planctomycetota bacterium]
MRQRYGVRNPVAPWLAAVLALGCATVALAVDYPIQIHRGNGLANVFAKLNAGQSATIAYIGGSVTEMTGYRTNVTSWFNSKYPGRITELNAGWSGTGSLVGAMRYARDVLAQNPDLVFIEFAVNDLPEDPVSFIECNSEGMVRQSWTQNSMAD